MSPFLCPSSKNLVYFEALENRRLLSAASLDPSFGVGGVVVEAAHVTPNDMVVEADGTILITDSTQLFCFNADGSPDTSFGTDGVVTPGFTVAGVAVQSDGKIVVGGDVVGAYDGFNWTGDWAVARYNANGTPDTTFGSGTGQVITQADGYTLAPSAIGVVIEPDDNIVVGGGPDIENVGGDDDYSAICFNADGSVNTAFGTDGEANSGVNDVFYEQALSMADTPSGDIVIGGWDARIFVTVGSAVVFNEAGQVLSIPNLIAKGGVSGVGSTSNGAPIFVSGAGNGGILHVGSTDTHFAFDPFSAFGQNTLGVTSGDQPVVLGDGPRGIGLARFNSDGTIDDTFGLSGSGTLTPQMLGFRQPVTPTNVVVETNGDILVAGATADGSLFLASVQDGSNLVDQESPIVYCDPERISQQGPRRYQFTVQYAASQSVNAATLGDDNIVVTDLHGVRERARLVSLSTSGNVSTATYTIRVNKFARRHSMATLNINLRPNQVFDNFGNVVAPGLLAQFQAVFN